MYKKITLESANEVILQLVNEESFERLPFFVTLAGVSYKNPQYKIIRENSECSCLEYIISGKGYVRNNDDEYTLEAGDVYFLKKGDNHLYYSSQDEPWEKIWINIKGDLCASLVENYNLKNTVKIKNLDVYHIFKSIIYKIENSDEDTKILMDEIAIDFMKLIIAMKNQRVSTTGESNFSSKAKSYIDRNIEAKITIDNLAKLVNVSKSQLGRAFKKQYNITPYEYILKRKIDTAKSLLINTNMSIKEVANYLNFSDEHHFSKIYKQKIGKSPSLDNKI